MTQSTFTWDSIWHDWFCTLSPTSMSCIQDKTLEAIDCEFTSSQCQNWTCYSYYGGTAYFILRFVPLGHKWQLMVLVGLCTQSVVLLEWHKAQLWMQDVLRFGMNRLNCQKAAIKGNLLLYPLTKHLSGYTKGLIKYKPFLTFFFLHLNCYHLTLALNLSGCWLKNEWATFHLHLNATITLKISVITAKQLRRLHFKGL